MNSGSALCKKDVVRTVIGGYILKENVLFYIKRCLDEEST